ncbi:MAG: 2-C-methyl-D-erythritol 4-phosphate cytidylyltransferase [Actinobacteria bacterium]|nr:2-C-methyl-D-erythritol 4-phosphate cytidylyltransferase [Actinomycetota bacterium]
MNGGAPGPPPGPGEVVVVLLAAGAGTRLGGGRPKAFIPLAGRSILARAAASAASAPGVSSLVVAAPEGFEEEAVDHVAEAGKPALVITGGPDRQESVRLALEAVPADAPAIVCHDAARPFASARIFGAVLDALSEADGVVPGLPVPDTVKRVEGGLVVATELRHSLVLAQTPQAFRGPVLRDAHRRARVARRKATDDAALVEWAGYRVAVIPGEPGNFKITTAEDLARAELAVRDEGGGLDGVGDGRGPAGEPADVPEGG